MDTRIIRLSDTKTVWMSSSSAHLEIEEVPFQISSNQSRFVCISVDQKKAVIFPFQIFRVHGEDYYFGPSPAKFQIVQSTTISWLSSPSFLSRSAKLGSTAVETSKGLQLLGCCIVLVFFLFHFLKSNLRRQISTSASFPKQALLVTLIVLWAAPIPAHAPQLEGAAYKDIADRGAAVALAKSLSKLARARIEVDTAEKLTGAAASAEKVYNMIPTDTKGQLKNNQMRRKQKPHLQADAPFRVLNVCDNLSALSALTSDPEIIKVQDQCERAKK